MPPLPPGWLCAKDADPDFRWALDAQALCRSEMIEPRNMLWIHSAAPCGMHSFAAVMRRQSTGLRPVNGRLDKRFPPPRVSDSALKVSGNDTLHAGHVLVLLGASEAERAAAMQKAADMANSHTTTSFGGVWSAAPTVATRGW